MSDNTLVLKSINQLLEYSFFIPSYQRGFRWTDRQVEELLEDIDNFIPKQLENSEKSTWYCLQPIVVRECNEETKTRNNLTGTWYEVIDGQQRLTTIFLVIHYANEMWVGKQKNPEFQIKYETRDKSYEFLTKLAVEDVSNKVEINDANIDFYHISMAYNKIHNWVLDYKRKFNRDFDYNNFQSKFKSNSNVIWYNVNGGSDSYDIFTRLNIGKIQLTNAELIRALFLKKWNNSEAVDKLRLKQLHIASEWDRIENTLQENSFWYFIYNKIDSNNTKYATRIEYIFDLYANKPEGAEDKYTFYTFQKEFEESRNNSNNKTPDTEAIWLRIKKYFLTFEEWYKDRTLYHLIGFLISIDYKIQDILNPKRENKNLTIRTKTDFKKFLITEIQGQVAFNINELKYGDNRIKTVLLLFNIQTILSNNRSNMRFPFNLYKNENWDIEHIRSQTDKNLIGNDRKEWAKDMLEYFTGFNDVVLQQTFIENIENQELEIFKTISENEKTKHTLLELLYIAYSDKIDNLRFTNVYTQICIELKENNEPSKYAISNLALLDSSTNRSYKNAFFPIKRKIILQNDKQGTFIPICTKNVFMKAYSKRFDEIMYWNKYDADFYLKAIEDTLVDYLPKPQVNNGIE